MKCMWCQKRLWWWQPKKGSMPLSRTLHSVCQAERAKYPAISDRVDARREEACEASAK